MKCGNACGGWARPLAAGNQWDIIKQVGREGREGSGLAWSGLAEEGSQGWREVDGVTKNSLESPLRDGGHILSSLRKAKNPPPTPTRQLPVGKELRGYAEVGWDSVGLELCWIPTTRNPHPAVKLPVASLTLQTVSVAQKEAGLPGPKEGG